MRFVAVWYAAGALLAFVVIPLGIGFARAPVHGLVAQVVPEPLTPSVLNLVGNGGATVAVIVVTRLFLLQMKDTHATLMNQQDRAFRQFSDKLDLIDRRNYETDRDRQGQFQGVLERAITNQENMAKHLADLKSAIGLHSQSTIAHEALLERIIEAGNEHLRAIADLRADIARARKPDPNH